MVAGYNTISMGTGRKEFSPKKERPGLEEYIRVRLEETDNGSFVAFPVYGKSGMLSTMVKADAMIVIPMNTEGFSKGESVLATYFNF